MIRPYTMLRIYVDINNRDEQDRIRLNTTGSKRDLHNHASEILDGLRVILYMTDEFEVEGILVFDEIWRGIPDWSTLRYTPP